MSDKKKDNPFSELLERLTERAEGHEHGEACPNCHPPLSHADMIQHLRVGFGLLTRVPELKPGDIIRGVRELTESHIRDREHPHILVEILATPLQLTLDAEGLALPYTAKRYDCVIASCIPVKGNGWILRHYADLREWELYPDADKLKADTHS